MSSIRVDFTNITAIRSDIIHHAQEIGLLDEKGGHTNPPSSGNPEQELTPQQIDYLQTLLDLNLKPITARAEQLIDHFSRLPELQRILDPAYFFAPASSGVIEQPEKDKKLEEHYKTQYLGRSISSDVIEGYNTQRNNAFVNIQSVRKKWGVYEILHCIRGQKQISKLKKELKISSANARKHGFEEIANQAAEKAAVKAFLEHCEYARMHSSCAPPTENEKLLEDVLYLIKYVDALKKLQVVPTIVSTTSKISLRNSWNDVARRLGTFVLSLASIKDQVARLEKALNTDVPEKKPAKVTLYNVELWQERLSELLRGMSGSHAGPQAFMQRLATALHQSPNLAFESWMRIHNFNEQNKKFARVLFEQFKLLLEYQSCRVEPKSSDFAKILEDSKRAVREAKLDMHRRNLAMAQSSSRVSSTREAKLDTYSRNHSMVQSSPSAQAVSSTKTESRQSVGQFLSKALKTLRNHWKKILLFGLVGAGFAAFCVATFGAGLGVGAGIGISFAALMGSSTVTAGALACRSTSQQDVKTIDVGELGSGRRRSSSSSTVISRFVCCNPFNLIDYKGGDVTSEQAIGGKCHSSPIRRTTAVTDIPGLVPQSAPSDSRRPG